jgi:ribosomal-protein-alanine N-acetyltransferase
MSGPKFLADATQLPTLEGERVRLRHVTRADAASFFAVFTHPDVMRYWAYPPWTSMAQADDLVTSIFDHFAARTLFQWGLALRDDDRVIGHITLAALDATHRRAEFGYALHRAHWGKGLMHEAHCLILDYAFGALGMHRIEADVDPRNAASIRSLERLGFKREGYLRERWHVAGEIQDGLYYGLLTHEWAARRPSLKS